MPLLKGKGCKARPDSVLRYITRSDKAGIVTSFYLNDNRSYAVQFKETADIFHTCKRHGERKYYHFIHSFSPQDNISYEDAHRITEELVRKAFPENEAVIATHTDTGVVHCHIVLNAVSFKTGRKIHLKNREYADLKDLSNELAVKYDYSPLDWRKPARKHETTAEHNIMLSGGTSWKEQLREVIDEALKTVSSIEAFEAFLGKFGVKLSRNTAKTISFLHPEKERAVRGEKLGQAYTKGAITNAITENNRRLNAAGAIQTDTVGAARAYDGNAVQPIRERPAETDSCRLFGAVQPLTDRDDEHTGRSEQADRTVTNPAQPQRKRRSR